MLAHGEYERVVDGELEALGLSYVQVMTGSVGGWMAEEKVIRRIVAGVVDWEGECEGVRVVFD